MDPFHPAPKCPVCDFENISYRHTVILIGSERSEFLTLTCQRCLYIWKMETKNAPEP